MDKQWFIDNLLDQIQNWNKEIENIENMVEAAYIRIDELEEEMLAERGL